jgi:ribosome silencing factor RsfS/YbeB/iojap
VTGQAKTRATRKPAAKPAAEPKAEAPAKRPKPAAKAAAPKAKPAAKPDRLPKAEAPAKAAAPKPRAKPAAPKASKAAVTAGPAKASRARKVKPSPQLLELMVEAAVKSLEDDKAEALVVLDVTGRASFADRMIVATGLAERQIAAMAEHLDKALAEVGWKRTRVEASPDWVLIDAGDLIVHLFKPEAREAYAIERMWGPDSPAAEDS